MTEKLRPGDNPEKMGVKYDDGKSRMDLIPPEGVAAIADILGIGAKKYAARNWEQGMDWSRPYGAALRHLFAWWGGEKVDKDTGRSHLWHAATNLFFLITYELRGIGKDDRPVKPMPPVLITGIKYAYGPYGKDGPCG